jgi:hypothetical protein
MKEELESDLKWFQLFLFKGQSNHNLGKQGAQVRAKSGLIDVLGYGLKYLFGTADAKDVKRLTAVSDELHVFKTQMVHAADQHLTYLGNLEQMTKRDTKDINELAGALPDSVRNFSLQLNRNEADLLDTQVAIEKQVR